MNEIQIIFCFKVGSTMPVFIFMQLSGSAREYPCHYDSLLTDSSTTIGDAASQLHPHLAPLGSTHAR